MNKKLLLALAVAGAVSAGFAAGKDPVVMRVDGRDVHRSEFEYLYNKNAGQQLEPQSLRDYAELFKIYKLKVAEALAQGVDTTAAFRKEFSGYQKELAAPYLIDSTYYKKLLKEIHARAGEEVEVSHIMLMKPRQFGGQVGRGAYTLADSLLSELHAGADFADLAARFSQDGGSAKRGGSLGYITTLMTPWEFETAAYTLKPGQISGIVDSPVGVHILKGGKHRKARGTVEALHILKQVPADASAEKQTAIKAEIDSIYQLVTAPGASFEEIASRLSDDRGSARHGGSVGWFGTGRMVPEFDSVAFAQPVGAISQPVRTRFGWHIIKTTGHKDVPSFEESETQYRQVLDNPESPFAKLTYAQFGEKLAKKYKAKTDSKLLSAMKKYATEQGMDSAFYATWEENPAILCRWKGGEFTAADFIKQLRRFVPESKGPAAGRYVQSRFNNFLNQKLYALALQDLPSENAAYRNLLGEYRDGMLLFEVSNANVWDKASRDTQGLEAFFRAHKGGYTWSAPRAKGLLVQCASDSVAAEIQAKIAPLTQAEALTLIRSEYPQAKADEVLLGRGENPLVDVLAFGGEPVVNSDSSRPAYFMSFLRVISQPEEAADVRGQVTADYQNELETLWVESLRQKYPIEVLDPALK